MKYSAIAVCVSGASIVLSAPTTSSPSDLDVSQQSSLIQPRAPIKPTTVLDQHQNQAAHISPTHQLDGGAASVATREVLENNTEGYSVLFARGPTSASSGDAGSSHGKRKEPSYEDSDQSSEFSEESHSDYRPSRQLKETLRDSIASGRPLTRKTASFFTALPNPDFGEESDTIYAHKSREPPKKRSRKSARNRTGDYSRPRDTKYWRYETATESEPESMMEDAPAQLADRSSVTHGHGSLPKPQEENDVAPGNTLHSIEPVTPVTGADNNPNEFWEHPRTEPIDESYPHEVLEQHPTLQWYTRQMWAPRPKGSVFNPNAPGKPPPFQTEPPDEYSPRKVLEQNPTLKEYTKRMWAPKREGSIFNPNAPEKLTPADSRLSTRPGGEAGSQAAASVPSSSHAAYPLNIHQSSKQHDVVPKPTEASRSSERDESQDNVPRKFRKYQQPESSSSQSVKVKDNDAMQVDKRGLDELD